MEALTAGLDIIQKVAWAYAAYLVFSGGFSYFDGYKSENSADKDKGSRNMIAGGGIALIATTLIPLISAQLS